MPPFHHCKVHLFLPLLYLLSLFVLLLCEGAKPLSHLLTTTIQIHGFRVIFVVFFETNFDLILPFKSLSLLYHFLHPSLLSLPHLNYFVTSAPLSVSLPPVAVNTTLSVSFFQGRCSTLGHESPRLFLNIFFLCWDVEQRVLLRKPLLYLFNERRFCVC